MMPPLVNVPTHVLVKMLHNTADLFAGLGESQILSDDPNARILEQLMRSAMVSKATHLREAARRLAAQPAALAERVMDSLARCTPDQHYYTRGEARCNCGKVPF